MCSGGGGGGGGGGGEGERECEVGEEVASVSGSHPAFYRLQ